MDLADVATSSVGKTCQKSARQLPNVNVSPNVFSISKGSPNLLLYTSTIRPPVLTITQSCLSLVVSMRTKNLFQDSPSLLIPWFAWVLQVRYRKAIWNEQEGLSAPELTQRGSVTHTVRAATMWLLAIKEHIPSSRLSFPVGWTEITRPRLSSFSLTRRPICDSLNRTRQRQPLFFFLLFFFFFFCVGGSLQK